MRTRLVQNKANPYVLVTRESTSTFEFDHPPVNWIAHYTAQETQCWKTIF